MPHKGLSYFFLGLGGLLPLPPPLFSPGFLEGHPASLGSIVGFPFPAAMQIGAIGLWGLLGLGEYIFIALSFHKFAMTLQTLQGGF